MGACGCEMRACGSRMGACGREVLSCGYEMRARGCVMQVDGSVMQAGGAAMHVNGCTVGACGGSVQACGYEMRAGGCVMKITGGEDRACGSSMGACGPEVRACGRVMRVKESGVKQKSRETPARVGGDPLGRRYHGGATDLRGRGKGDWRGSSLEELRCRPETVVLSGAKDLEVAKGMRPFAALRATGASRRASLLKAGSKWRKVSKDSLARRGCREFAFGGV